MFQLEQEDLIIIEFGLSEEDKKLLEKKDRSTRSKSVNLEKDVFPELKKLAEKEHLNIEIVRPKDKSGKNLYRNTNIYKMTICRKEGTIGAFLCGFATSNNPVDNTSSGPNGFIEVESTDEKIMIFYWKNEKGDYDIIVCEKINDSDSTAAVSSRYPYNKKTIITAIAAKENDSMNCFHFKDWIKKIAKGGQN